MKKYISYFLEGLAFLLAFVFASCASVPRVIFPQDGIYSYDFDRYVENVELAVIYKAYGMEAFQIIQKKSVGNAVYMQGGSFIEPETGIMISISALGNVSSPDNPSISGKYKRNGEFFFQGYYEENSQVLKIAIRGILLPTDASSRASSKYNGDFVLVDNGTERKQKVKIENGIYTWEYEDKQADDFTTWPTLVAPDGSIHCGFEMTVHTGVKGASEMVVSSKNESFGKVTPDGTISLKTLTKNSGTGQSGASEEITFNGTRGTENLNQITKDESDDSSVEKYFTKKRKTIQNQVKENPPEWYSDFIDNDEEYIYGSARKTFDDKNSALKIAEITAASQIKMTLSSEVQVHSEAKKSMSQDDSSGTKIESSFFSAVDSFSKINIPYVVKNSFYDEKTKTAYVVTALSRAEAEKLLSKAVSNK